MSEGRIHDLSQIYHFLPVCTHAPQNNNAIWMSIAADNVTSEDVELLTKRSLQARKPAVIRSDWDGLNVNTHLPTM